MVVLRCLYIAEAVQRGKCISYDAEMKSESEFTNILILIIVICLNDLKISSPFFPNGSQTDGRFATEDIFCGGYYAWASYHETWSSAW